MKTRTFVITTALSAASTLASLALCIYAAATQKYWIPAAMVAFGITGVILTAYIRTRKHHEKR